jgi:hypothetical protein
MVLTIGNVGGLLESGTGVSSESGTGVSRHRGQFRHSDMLLETTLSSSDRKGCVAVLGNLICHAI